MKDSKIGWTDHTQNFWQGCNKVSPACTHCYIGRVMRHRGREPFDGPMRTQTWKDPFKWNRRAESEGRRHRVFTCSLSDFFHLEADPWRAEAWEVIRDCENLDWLILTKRPELVAQRLPADWGAGYKNVWLGVTVETQEYRHRIEEILSIPAPIHFVSAEPLLEAIDFEPYLDRLDWIITGCEQAAEKKRRTMDVDWVRDLRDQCQKTQTAFFFKQYYEGNQIREDGLLDGKVCQHWPLPTTPLRLRRRNPGRFAA